MKYSEIEGEDYFYYQKELIYDVNSPKISTLLESFKDIWKYKGDSMSLNHYLKLNFDSSFDFIVDGLVSDYGTDSYNLDILSLALEERMWSSGDRDYRINKPLFIYYRVDIKTYYFKY